MKKEIGTDFVFVTDLVDIVSLSSYDHDDRNPKPPPEDSVHI